MARIHVVGQTAAGKDTVAKILSQKLNIPHARVSDIVKQLCEKYKTTPEQLKGAPQLEEALSAEVSKVAGDIMIRGFSYHVVVSGARESRLVLPSDFVIYVYTDDDQTRINRFAEREKFPVNGDTARRLLAKDEHERVLGFKDVAARATAFIDNSEGKDLQKQVDAIVSILRSGIYHTYNIVTFNPRVAAGLGWVTPVEPEQVQQNGIDLTISEVYELVGCEGSLSHDNKIETRRQGIRTQPHAYFLNEQSKQGFYKFEPGKAYEVVFNEVVNVPCNAVGLCWQRSTLNRNGVNLFTCVWDSGYHGRGSGTLKTTNTFYIEKGARVAQIVFFKADAAGAYQGSYQNERL